MKRWALAAAMLALSCTKQDEIDEQSIEPDIEALQPGGDTAPRRAASAPVYVGVWAVDPALCAISPGTAAPGPIGITENEFIGYENRCRIGEAAEGTEGGWRLSLVCMAAGVETVETIEVDVDGGMLRMNRAAAPEIAFVRCPEEN